jgi:hypothetical protein
MEFFNSLTLDLKILLVGIFGCALLALFSGNRKTEKRYMVALALLAVAGVYRFTHVPGDDQAGFSAAPNSPAPVATAPPKRVPLASTSGK